MRNSRCISFLEIYCHKIIQVVINSFQMFLVISVSWENFCLLLTGFYIPIAIILCGSLLSICITEYSRKYIFSHWQLFVCPPIVQFQTYFITICHFCSLCFYQMQIMTRIGKDEEAKLNWS